MTVAGRDGTAICVGDQIVTRTNYRALRTDCGAMVRNRAGWTVTGITGTGITATGTDGSVHLPADYVRASVELGYAHTVDGDVGMIPTNVDHLHAATPVTPVCPPCTPLTK